MVTTKKAVEKLTTEIKQDEGFFMSYQANIAMAFQDEYYRCEKKYKNKTDIHQISNTAAKNFLNLWCSGGK